MIPFQIPDKNVTIPFQIVLHVLLIPFHIPCKNVVIPFHTVSAYCLTVSQFLYNATPAVTNPVIAITARPIGPESPAIAIFIKGNIVDTTEITGLKTEKAADKPVITPANVTIAVTNPELFVAHSTNFVIISVTLTTSGANTRARSAIAFCSFAFASALF